MISVGKYEIAFDEFGTGRPLLLIHGFPFHRKMWTRQGGPLSEAFQVLVPDLPGFGGSTAPESIDTLTMDELADILIEFLLVQEISEPVVVCGLSMGGYVALSMLRRHASRIAAAILCDTRAGADSDEVRANRLALAENVMKDGTGPVADTMIPKLLSTHIQRNRPEIVDEVRAMITSTAPSTIAAVSRGMAQRADSTDLLPTISVPSLLIVGEEDVPSPPEEMQEMSRAIPAGRLVRLANAGHLTPIEQPEAFNANVKMFLRDLPR